MEAHFDQILKIEGRPPSQKDVYEKRLARINEAIGWSEGGFSDKHYHGIWEDDTFKVALGKPGKEAAPEESGYKGVLNPNDMRPDLFKNGTNMNLAATFGDVVHDLEGVAKVEKYCVELLGVLFFRSAFLLDHMPVELPDGKVVYRYRPNPEVIEYIAQRIPSIYDVPPMVFLQYLDAIALNEDVKYHTKGKNLSKEKTGGNNNYRTYVMIIAVITGDLPISAIARLLLRSNVSPISNKDALEVLPHLK